LFITKNWQIHFQQIQIISIVKSKEVSKEDFYGNKFASAAPAGTRRAVPAGAPNSKPRFPLAHRALILLIFQQEKPAQRRRHLRSIDPPS